MAMKWMIKECREKKHRRMLMPEKLSHEPLEAFHNQGPVIKKKRDMHKMAEASRARARCRRWWTRPTARNDGSRSPSENHLPAA